MSVANGRAAAADLRRSVRTKATLPVSVSIVGPEGGVLAWGRAILSDIGDAGLHLSMILLHSGHLPLEPWFQLVIVPLQADLRDLRIKARPVHIHFSSAGADIGAEIIETAGGIERLGGIP